MDLPKRVPQEEYRRAVLEEPTQPLRTVEYIDKQDNEQDEDWFWEAMGRGLR